MMRVVLVAGGGAVPLKEPFGCGFDPIGNLWIIEMASGNRLLKRDGKGVLTTVAGPQPFNGPHNLAVLPDGDVLVADTWNGMIRRVAAKTGSVSVLPGFSVPADQAKAAGPYCITLDFAGKTLFIADLRRVQALELATGQLRVVAGSGKKGVPQDGALALDSPLADPRAVAPDRQGNVYILERGGNALRVVDKAGRIRTLVQGPLKGPKHLCIDKDDSVLIADAENHVIRRYLPQTGKLEIVAGTGKAGSEGLGRDPKECQLNRPHGVTVHPKTGEIYITDSYNNRILSISRG